MSGLTLSGVTVRYDDLVAVSDVSLALPAGEVLAVLGPSGCGKSTLLRAVAGLEPVAAGSIAYDGADLAGVPTHRRGFALMFQDGQLFGHLSVGRNVGYALRLRRTPRAELATRVDELLELVGLTGYADRLPATLSGGERQRVALARALAVEPRLILLDEPLSALDASLRERLAGDLREILHRAGTTALMVTHDHDEAFAVADRIAVMRAGRLIQDGPIGDVWQHPTDADTALLPGLRHRARRRPGRPDGGGGRAAGGPRRGAAPVGSRRRRRGAGRGRRAVRARDSRAAPPRRRRAGPRLLACGGAPRQPCRARRPGAAAHRPLADGGRAQGGRRTRPTLE